MVGLFNQFKGAKNSFKTESKRCKLQDIERFDSASYWSVDRWWSKEEKIELGIEEEETILTLEEFEERINDTSKKIEEIRKKIKELK